MGDIAFDIVEFAVEGPGWLQDLWIRAGFGDDILYFILWWAFELVTALIALVFVVTR